MKMDKIPALNQKTQLPSTPIFAFTKSPHCYATTTHITNHVHRENNRVTNADERASFNNITVFLAKLKLRMAMFEEVQKLYLNRLTDMYADDETNIIVNDVTLMLLPNLIRKRFYGASITFVMRCPFFRLLMYLAYLRVAKSCWKAVWELI